MRKDTFFGLGYKIQNCIKTKNVQSLQGVDICLTTESSIFSNTQEMLKNSRKGSFFGLGYEEQCYRKAKSDESSRGVDSCLTAVSDNFSNTQYKVEGNQKMIRVRKVSTC